VQFISLDASEWLPSLMTGCHPSSRQILFHIIAEICQKTDTIGAPLINRQTNRVFGSVCLDFLTVECSLHSIEQAYAATVKRIAQEISDKIIAD